MSTLRHCSFPCFATSSRPTLAAHFGGISSPRIQQGRFIRRRSQMVSFQASAGTASQPAAAGASQEKQHNLNGAAAASEELSGPMLEPSAFNKNWVRLAWVSAALIVAARSTEFLPVKAAGFIHLLAWGVWLGSNVWTTFIAGITMFKNLPRQTFGKLQAKLFPQYFAVAIAAGVLQLGTLAFGVPGGIAQTQLITLGTALVCSLANWLYVEPVATNLMFERYNLENVQGEKDAAKIKQLYKQFGKFHGISSLLNLVALGAVVGHGWWLASRLTLAVV
ncbi:probable transmembrane protein 205 at C-terminar half [Coccomyxa sp. Obi]|nr:probable transmembrane protein 205 at C-terminar half [Coccomyxa sp. Obi]